MTLNSCFTLNSGWLFPDAFRWRTNYFAYWHSHYDLWHCCYK